MFDRRMIDGSKLRTLTLACVALAAVAILAAGCGGGGSSSEGSTKSDEGTSITASSDEGGSAEITRYEKELAAAYKGTYTDPVGGPVKAEPGENVWVISGGLASEAAQLSTQVMKEVGEKLGWKVTVFDGKYEASRYTTGTEQAVAAGADGIILDYVDCEPIRAPLERAKKAGIPVVGLESKDCDPPLETPVLFADGMTFEEWAVGYAEYAAIYIAAKTEGKAKVIQTEETDLVTTKISGEAFADYMENKCGECEIAEDIQFVGASFGSLQSKIEQALNQHPDANAFYPSYDQVLTVGGGAAALRASGRLPEITSAGGEGSPAGIELIRNEEGLEACSGANVEWAGYESITLMARIFAGQDPSESNSGIGWQLCDKEHNFPPKGSGFQPSIDYAAAYDKILGIS